MGCPVPRADAIGWHIGTMHQMLGHAKAAAFLGMDPRSQADCVLCRWENGMASDEEAELALGGRPAPGPEPAGFRCWQDGGVTHHVHEPGTPCPLGRMEL